MKTNLSLKELTNKLSTIEERRKLALSASGVGIWDWDIINDTLFWDEGMCYIYGLTMEQFGGRYEAWASLLHQEDKQQTEKAIQRCLADSAQPYSFKFRIKRDNCWRIVSGFGNCIRDIDDRPIRMVGINVLEPDFCAEHCTRSKENNPCDICPTRFARLYQVISSDGPK